MRVGRRLRAASAVLVALFASVGQAQPRDIAGLLIRVDDIGMSHAVNAALEELAATGAPLSASVMPAAPWFDHAADLLRRSPHIAVGVHLTLNSEWRGYRWGPVLGAQSVPSLVDGSGYFPASTAAFLAQPFDTAEVERELVAQVDRVRAAGLRVDYLDYHMGTAIATPALRAIVERLAHRYGVGISRWYGERHTSLFAAPVARKGDVLAAAVDSLPADALGLLVVHAATRTPESLALVDLNNPAQNDSTGGVAQHRAAEREALLQWLRRRTSNTEPRLVTYRDVVAARGTAAMRSPFPAPAPPDR